MRDQARRYIRAARDLCESGADVADFGQTVDRDFDELYAPGVLAFVPRGSGAVGAGILEG